MCVCTLLLLLLFSFLYEIFPDPWHVLGISGFICGCAVVTRNVKQEQHTPLKRIHFSVSLFLSLAHFFRSFAHGFVCLYIFLMFYLFFLLAHSCRASPVEFNFSFNFVLFARFIHTFCSNMLLECSNGNANA